MTAETETSPYKTIEAYKTVARENGLVLQSYDDEADSGDFPDGPYDQLRYMRRMLARGVGEPKKVVKSIHRQLVSVRDEKGKPVKKEYLFYMVDFEVSDSRGVPYGVDGVIIGKYSKPRVVANEGRKYNPNTGDPIGPAKRLSGQETVYEIEVPKGKEARKKQLDEIVGDSFPENILYYYNDLREGNNRFKKDATFTYDDFVNKSIEELRDMSDGSGGSKGSNFYRDKNGNLIDRRSGTIVR